MSVERQALSVAETLYDAAMDESLWPKALSALADFTGSQSATLWLLDGTDQPRLPLLTILNFDPAFMREYLDGMVPLDPTVRYLVRHPRQPIVHDGLVITEQEKDRSAYYDWHGKWSDTRFRMVGQMIPAPSVQAGVALHRTRHAGRFQPRDIDQFALIHPHLERALTVGFRLGSMGALQQCTTDLLDRNPTAILLVNEHRRVVYANRSAESIDGQHDGIHFSAEGIAIACKKENALLQRLIAQSVAASSSPLVTPGGVMRVPRPSLKRPFCVFVSPVSRRYPALSSFKPAVCVLVTDPEAHIQLPAHALQAAFSFTPAEASLAAILARGVELRAAAEELHITYGTARARLAEIFHKTGTRRQGELIQLLFTAITGC